MKFLVISIILFLIFGCYSIKLEFPQNLAPYSLKRSLAWD